MDKFDIVDFRPIRSLPNLALGHYVVNLGNAFGTHPGYQGENAFPPTTVSNPKQLVEIGKRFIEATTAAEGGGNKELDLLQTLRPITEHHASGTIRWAVLRSVLENDASLLANLGLQFKKKRIRSNSRTLVGAPENPKAKHGRLSSTVELSCGKVAGAVMYYVAVCKGDPTQESSWSDAAQSPSCRKIVIEGLTPGELYHFRMRCYGPGGYSAWSSVITLRSL